MKQRAIIIDLDGTLCNAKHRLHHLDKKPKDWDGFFAQAKNDVPNRWCIEIIMAFFNRGYMPVFLTGRGEEDKEMTKQWLQQVRVDHNKAYFEHFSDFSKFPLFMRPKGDRRQDTQVKAEIYFANIEPYYDVLFAVDDRGSVVQMWREIGITCLQCDHWEEKTDASVHKEIAAHFLTRGAENEKA